MLTSANSEPLEGQPSPPNVLVTLWGEQSIARFAPYLLAFFAIAFAWLDLTFLTPLQDMQRYFEASRNFLNGQIPYLGFNMEYPPGALLFSGFPQLILKAVRFLGAAKTNVQQDFALYRQIFAYQMLLLNYTAAALVWRIAGQLTPAMSPGQSLTTPFDGTQKTHQSEPSVRIRYNQTMATLAYLGLVGSMGPLALERYDLGFVVLTLAFVESVLAKRAMGWTDCLLALGVWTKLISVIFVPLYWMTSYCLRHPSELKTSAVMRWLREHALFSGLRFFAATTFLFGPFYYLAGQKFFSFLTYHKERGIQMESSYASLLMMSHHIFKTPIRPQYQYGAMEVINDWTDFWARMSVLVTGGVLAIVTLFFRRRLIRAAGEGSAVVGHVFTMGVCALLCALMLASKVLSPQYLLWVVPFAGLLTVQKTYTMRPAFLSLLATVLMTNLISFFYYVPMIRGDAFSTGIMFLRNVFLLILLLSLIEWPRYTVKPFGLPKRGQHLLSRLHGEPLFLLAVGLSAFWVFLANLSETTANDIWIQLKSGADIWASGKLPYTEVYSATVSGRPFIAHEWLSGLVFYALTEWMGDGGLSFLAAFVALGTFALMYLTFAKDVRRQFWYLPLLLLTSYLVAFRILLRPHIFTILAQAALLFLSERWRRNGRHRELLWLIPIQLVWVNLHGAALFGPAFVAMLTGLVGLIVCIPRLGRDSETRPYAITDVLVLGGMTFALCAACVLNPYGTDLVKFSLELLGNDYVKNRVWEWTTPFLSMNLGYYWLYIMIVTLAGLWLSLVFVAPTLPLIDLAYAVLVSYLVVRANRFVPDFAMFAFVVVARAWTRLSAKALSASCHRPSVHWLSVCASILLICNCGVFGYAHSAREHRPLPGWGFGGDMPYQEVAFLKRLNLEGNIYNEYSDGSLIIFGLNPKMKPVLDSRIDLYPLDLIARYDQAYSAPSPMKQYLDKFRVSTVMLAQGRASPAVINMLDTAPEWRRIWNYNHRIIWARRDVLQKTRSAG